MEMTKADREGTWQATKSENTRKAIMDATIRCYVSYGFTETTVAKIAEAAGLSRGALMHHFESRHDIIRASVHHLVDQRMNEYEHLVSAAATDGGTTVTRENLRITMYALWEFFHLPSHTAYQELMLAARANAELGGIMTRAQLELDQRISDSIRSMFPAWENRETIRQLVTDLTFFAFQGMAISSLTSPDDRRAKDLIDFLIAEILRTYRSSKR